MYKLTKEKQKEREERIKKIQKFLKINDGSIVGKEEECVRFIEGMKDNERFGNRSLAGKISRLKSSIKLLNIISIEV